MYVSERGVVHHACVVDVIQHEFVCLTIGEVASEVLHVTWWAVLVVSGSLDVVDVGLRGGPKINDCSYLKPWRGVHVHSRLVQFC